MSTSSRPRECKCPKYSTSAPFRTAISVSIKLINPTAINRRRRARRAGPPAPARPFGQSRVRDSWSRFGDRAEQVLGAEAWKGNPRRCWNYAVDCLRCVSADGIRRSALVQGIPAQPVHHPVIGQTGSPPRYRIARKPEGPAYGAAFRCGRGLQRDPARQRPSGTNSVGAWKRTVNPGNPCCKQSRRTSTRYRPI